jgi:hypothetical protein
MSHSLIPYGIRDFVKTIHRHHKQSLNLYAGLQAFHCVFLPLWGYQCLLKDVHFGLNHK